MNLPRVVAPVLSVVTVAVVLVFGVLLLVGWAFLTMGQSDDYLP